MMGRKLVYLAALLLPLVFLGAEAARHAWHRTSAPQYTVVIDGYDPRDLVYGEYLQFRYVWEDPKSQKPDGVDIRDLPGIGRIYLPEGHAWDLQEMMFGRKNTFTVNARLMGKKAYADNLQIDGKSWQEPLDAWRRNRDNQTE